MALHGVLSSKPSNVLRFLQESMRLQPVAANSLRRVAVRDVRLSNGVLLPAGVSIEMAQYSMFRNPAWGWKNPNAYLPVRQLITEEPPNLTYIRFFRSLSLAVSLVLPDFIH